MLDFDYFILNLFLLGIFAHCGKKISQGKNFWGYVTPCILAFTFVQGCRYKRGYDYLHYVDVFNGSATTSSKLFDAFNDILKIFGFNGYSAFIVYAFVFCLCGMIFLKDYKQCAKWTFPLFIISLMSFEEYFIRQAFSFSFFFLYLKNLLKIESLKISNLIKNCRIVLAALFFAVICVALHTANIIGIVFFFTLYFYVKKMIPYKFAIPIYFSCVYILPSMFDFSWLQPLVSFAGENSSMGNVYASNSDLWFSSSGKNSIYTRNVYMQFIEFSAVSSLVYFANKFQNFINDKKLHFTLFLNTFFLGKCIQSLFLQLELLNRIGQVLSLLGFMIVAIVWCNKDILVKNRNIIHKIMYFTLLYFLYSYLRYLFTPGNMTLFIWDAPIGIGF